VVSSPSFLYIEIIKAREHPPKSHYASLPSPPKSSSTLLSAMAETGGSSTTIADPEENIDAVSAAGNAADNKETPKARRNRMRMIAERKRRSRLRNYFGELQALVPHVTDKVRLSIR